MVLVNLESSTCRSSPPASSSRGAGGRALPSAAKRATTATSKLAIFSFGHMILVTCAVNLVANDERAGHIVEFLNRAFQTNDWGLAIPLLAKYQPFVVSDDQEQPTTYLLHGFPHRIASTLSRYVFARLTARLSVTRSGCRTTTCLPNDGGDEDDGPNDDVGLRSQVELRCISSLLLAKKYTSENSPLQHRPQFRDRRTRNGPRKVIELLFRI
ncbi:hypothetical protein AAVH_13730, partial [Aphelenchoides avenae]